MNVKSFLLSFFAVVFVAALFWPSYGGLRERFKRSACASNMTKIGMALAHYASDNDGFLPPGDMHEAMKLLRSLDYVGVDLLRGLSLKNYRLNEPIPLEREMTPFLYFGAGANLKSAPRTEPLFCDPPERHKRFGHVLFADGHLEGFSGPDWFERSVKPLLAKKEGAEAKP